MSIKLEKEYGNTPYDKSVGRRLLQDTAGQDKYHVTFLEDNLATLNRTIKNVFTILVLF